MISRRPCSKCAHCEWEMMQGLTAILNENQTKVFQEQMQRMGQRGQRGQGQRGQRGGQGGRGGGRGGGGGGGGGE